MMIYYLVNALKLMFCLFFYGTQEMKVNWATSPGNAPKQDTSSKSHNFDICLIFFPSLFVVVVFMAHYIYCPSFLPAGHFVKGRKRSKLCTARFCARLLSALCG